MSNLTWKEMATSLVESIAESKTDEQKAALDICKPCPLMPDGEWVKAKFHLRTDKKFSDTPTALYVYVEEAPTLNLHVAQSTNIVALSDIVGLANKATYSVDTTTKNFYLDVGSNVGVFGEVRYVLHVPTYDDVTFSSPLQADPAWYQVSYSNVDSCTRQRYFIWSTDTDTSSADGNIIQALNGTHWTEESEIVVELYAYIITPEST